MPPVPARAETTDVNETDSAKGYEDRISRVIEYVFDHLDEDLDLNRLADVACLSPHHWHRVYSAMRGETIAATVKRLRLNRAAAFLAQTSMTVDAIAKRSGYPNVQSFTRIFSAVYGMPPATYRKRGSHTQFQLPARNSGGIMYDVKIATLPPMTAITVLHIGPYMEINKAFGTLFGILGSKGLLGPDVRSFGIFYDDVSTVPAAKLRSRAAAIMDRAVDVEPPLERTEIVGGEYVVLRHKGPYSDMKAAYEWLYGQWLPSSGRVPRDAAGLEEYLNDPRDTPPGELLSDIYIPLA
ncbi:MAG: AraC family transcriptional regulator [bacterium]